MHRFYLQRINIIPYEKPEFNKIEYLIDTEGLEYEEEKREYTAHNEDGVW
jgi:hypothetical protein